MRWSIIPLLHGDAVARERLSRSTFGYRPPRGGLERNLQFSERTFDESSIALGYSNLRITRVRSSAGPVVCQAADSASTRSTMRGALSPRWRASDAARRSAP